MQYFLKSVLVFSLLTGASVVHAGKITNISFAGPDDPNHPNVIQITIEGGFVQSGCDSTFAAIRNTDDRKHLTSFALAAFASKQSVSVVLNPSDQYFGSRCTISRISSI